MGTWRLVRDSAFCGLFLFSLRTSYPQASVIRSEVKEVLVPVVVTDRQGHHVPDLKMSDFLILEDGKPQRIVAVRTDIAAAPASLMQAAASGGSPSVVVPPSAATVSGSADPRRTYLILVDALHSSFENFKRVRDALGKFFEKEQAGMLSMRSSRSAGS